ATPAGRGGPGTRPVPRAPHDRSARHRPWPPRRHGAPAPQRDGRHPRGAGADAGGRRGPAGARARRQGATSLDGRGGVLLMARPPSNTPASLLRGALTTDWGSPLAPLRTAAERLVREVVERYDRVGDRIQALGTSPSAYHSLARDFPELFGRS